jgi:hypothetical protein
VAEIETSFVTDMKSASAITTYVSQRVFEDEADSKAREPYIVVRNVTNSREAWTQTLFGGTARINIYIYADRVATARSVGDAVLDRYKQFSGALGTHTVNYIEVSNARTFFGPGTEFRFIVDLVVHYKE